jgi:hypothetical protein
LMEWDLKDSIENYKKMEEIIGEYWSIGVEKHQGKKVNVIWKKKFKYN